MRRQLLFIFLMMFSIKSFGAPAYVNDPCAMRIVNNYPEAKKCETFTDQASAEKCLLGYAATKRLKCMTEEDADLRNKCVVSETVAAVNSMLPECIAKYKAKINAIVEAREIQLYGKSTYQINSEKQATAEKNKKNKNSKTLTKPDVP